MNPFTKLRNFYNETISELRKATWPSFSELKGSTFVVVVAVFILGTFISVADFSLSNWIEYATQILRNY